MTCKHSRWDPACSSYKYQTQVSVTPDSKNFTIEDSEQIGGILLLKVKYPNCSSCAYEGTKIMVFEGVTFRDAIKWREIDPHFRDVNSKSVTITQAPSPVARFPGSASGWKDALEYAQFKNS